MKIVASLAVFATSVLVSGAAAALAIRPAQAQEGEPRPISDTELLDYATSAYDKRQMMGQRVILGLNRSARVVAVFPCSDICPHYTTRIIHYDVPLSRCSEVSGVEKMVGVPRGIATVPEPFCIPRILAEHWDKYRR